jgi:hypothetical protein
MAAYRHCTFNFLTIRHGHLKERLALAGYTKTAAALGPPLSADLERLRSRASHSLLASTTTSL